MRSWIVALFLAISVIATPVPALAQQGEAQLRELVAWSAPLNDIQTRAQRAVRSVTALNAAIRSAGSRDEVMTLLRAAQPTITTARTELRALRAEADLIPAFASESIDESIVGLANISLAETKISIDLFEGAIGDIQQMLPALERRDVAELERLAGRMVTFGANFLRSQAATMRLGQLQLPITEPTHHIMGARAELMDGLYAMLNISAATGTSAITAAIARARSNITVGRGMAAAQRATFADTPEMEPLLSNTEEQLEVLAEFATDLERASARVSPRTPMPELLETLRVVGAHDRRLQILNQQGAALAAQWVAQ